METKQETEKKIELRSQEVQDVLGKVPPSILRWGITVIAMVLIVLLVGAYLFKYPEIVSGQAIITTKESKSFCTMLLPAAGSGKVKVGQRALVRLINYPDQEFGYLEGRVEGISNTPNVRDFYRIEIRLVNGLVTNYGVQLPIDRQLQGSAELVIDEVRLLVRFFPPLKNVLLN